MVGNASLGGCSGGAGAYAGTPAVSSSTDGSCGGFERDAEPFLGRDREVLARRVLVAGGSMAVLESEKGTTPARRAISCSPSCQCMASAARQGMAISSATFDHISALNLGSGQSIGLLRGHQSHTFRITSQVYFSCPRPTRFCVQGSFDNGDDN